MHSLKSLFAAIGFLVASVSMLWGVALTVLPWEPRNKYEAAAVVGGIFAFSLSSLAATWVLVRRARVDIALDAPERWRFSDYAICSESVLCGVFVVLAIYTLLT